jgi:uncharacterized damage-inducible protein DinB
MTPSEAKMINDFLVADFRYEMQTTLAVLAAAPKERLDYRPDGKSKTGLALLRHLALEDEWILNSIVAGSFSQPPDDSDACGIMSSEEAVACYKAKVPAALDRVAALSGDQLLKVIDLFGMVKMPAVNFVSLAMKHSVHHRGQLSTYLRAMGGRIPEIYGPNADSPVMAASKA